MTLWEDPPELVRSDEPRREAAATVRSYLPWLRRELLLEKVLQQVSPAAAAMLSRPPLPTSWVDSRLVYELHNAVLSLRGETGMTEMCLVSARESLGVLIRPVLSMFMKMTGASPASLYAQMPAITALFIKGVAFHWTRESESSGSLLLAYDGPTPPAIFHGWRGTSLFAFEVCRTQGKSELALSPDGSAARYALSWDRDGSGTDSEDLR